MVKQQQGTINGLTTKSKAERDAHAESYAAVDHEREAERECPATPGLLVGWM